MHVVTVFSMAVLACVIPAQAQWSITQEAVGQVTASPPTSSRSWTQGPGPNRPGGYGPQVYGGSSTAAGSASSIGYQVIVCRWTGSSSTVPDTINLKITARANVGVMSWGSGGSVQNTQVDNGFGALAVMSNPTKPSWISQDTYIRTYSTTGTITRISLPTATASISAINAGLVADVSQSAQADTRSVRIVRLGAVGDTEALAGGKWTTSGDTIYSYDYGDGNIGWNIQDFKAIINNPSNVSILDWGWTAQSSFVPGGLPNNLPTDKLVSNSESTASRAIVPNDYERSWLIVPEQTISFWCRFNDGVVASADYKLKVHTDYVGLPTVSGPKIVNVRPHPSAVTKKATTDGETLTATVTAPYSWTVSPQYFSVSNTVGNSVAAARWIIQGTYGLNLDVQSQAYFDDSITATVNGVPKDYATYMQIYDKVTEFQGTADYYDRAGYRGKTNYLAWYPFLSGTTFDVGGYQAAPIFYSP